MSDKDRKDDLPHRAPDDVEAIEREAKRSREALDSVPPPGDDPLHEGP